MSTAYYPQGMRSMPASGYNNSTLPSQYVSWKGTGALSNPVGTAASHIRPLTNNDQGNVFPTGFGLPRPIKHFRKGRVIPPQPIPEDPLNTPEQNHEIKLINYNINRFVISSKGASLGGGAGGRGLLNEMLDNPGSYLVKQNTPDEINGIIQNDKNCKTCEGVGIVATYYPNTTYLTDNPEPNTQNPILCCNAQYKAKRRAIYASTNISKSYYTSHKQYLQNRCQTYEQKVFNFQTPYPKQVTQEFLQEGIDPIIAANAKPGSALATLNTYVANCYPNAEIYDSTEQSLVAKLLNMLLSNNLITQEEFDNYIKLDNPYNFDVLFGYLKNLPAPKNELAVATFTDFISNPYWGVPFSGPSNPYGCKLTVYKPNNPQFAKQGAVDSSTRNLKLNVDVISTNAASLQNYNNTGQQLVTANELYAGIPPNVSNLYKNKAPNCNSPTIYPFQNKKLCYYKKMPQYQIPASQPSPYRYYPGVITSSNHYSQSPNTYNTTTGTSAYK